MTRSHSHLLASPIRLALPLSAALLGSSCSLLQGGQWVTPAVAQIVQPVARLAQMKFGRQAEFGLCTPPACPAVTPKALALPLPLAALPEFRPPAAATGLAVGEEAISPSPRTTIEVAGTSIHAPKPITKTVTVHFKFGDASLSAASKVVLEDAVAGASNTKYIVISGRTDSIGPATANWLLATVRARTVHDYLRAAHPNLAAVLKLEAQGACCYVASNETERGRSLNRRVDVLFSGYEEQPPGPPPMPAERPVAAFRFHPQPDP